MEYGSIQQSIFIDATPEVVYEVVSSPEHITQWYVDEAEYELAAGAVGHLGFGKSETQVTLPITVVEATPGARFSFRWVAPPAPELLPIGTAPDEGNSLLVVFEMTPQDGGTLLTVTESGMRELGWEAAVLETYYNDHSEGWMTLLGRLNTYVGQFTKQ